MRSDNGPHYSSSSLRSLQRIGYFTQNNQFWRSNGLAEKTVQTMKSLLEKDKDDNKDPHLMMLEARNTPVDN